MYVCLLAWSLKARQSALALFANILGFITSLVAFLFPTVLCTKQQMLYIISHQNNLSTTSLILFSCTFMLTYDHCHFVKNSQSS